MRDKWNKKEKLREEKSLFFEFLHFTLTEIIATQPLSRDYATIVTYLSKRFKHERRMKDKARRRATDSLFSEFPHLFDRNYCYLKTQPLVRE